MPIEWAEWDKPADKKKAVEETLKRIDRLNKGIYKDLGEMSKRCHEAVEKGDMSHLPMCYIRVIPENGNENSEGELYYVCRKCLSKYFMEHPKLARKRIIILRGRLTEEAHKKMMEELEKEEEKER